MCAIIGWTGQLPRGFLSYLLIESGSRGKDSTGIAFYGSFKDVKEKQEYNAIGAYKDVLDPSSFVKDEDVQKILSQARRSPTGIGHTRRASPGMPIDSRNAHPYGYWGLYFAHNGRVENWKALKMTLVEHFKGIVKNSVKESLKDAGTDAMVDSITDGLIDFVNDIDANCKALSIAVRDFWALGNFQQADYLWSTFGSKTGLDEQAFLNLPMRQLLKSADCTKYAADITTDSQVLGPFINARDFRLVEGCMALVWISRTSRGPEVYTMRYGKEAVSAKITWRWKCQSFTSKGKLIEESNDQGIKILTLVASTREIISNALNKLDDNIECEVEYEDYKEGHIYRLDINGLVDEGAVNVYEHPTQDEFSSQAV